MPHITLNFPHENEKKRKTFIVSVVLQSLANEMNQHRRIKFRFLILLIAKRDWESETLFAGEVYDLWQQRRYDVLDVSLMDCGSTKIASCGDDGAMLFEVF